MNGWQQHVDRIYWRLRLLSTKEGNEWFTKQVMAGAKEKDLGPHRVDAPPLGPEINFKQYQALENV